MSLGRGDAPQAETSVIRTYHFAAAGSTHAHAVGPGATLAGNADLTPTPDDQEHLRHLAKRDFGCILDGPTFDDRGEDPTGPTMARASPESGY